MKNSNILPIELPQRLPMVLPLILATLLTVYGDMARADACFVGTNGHDNTAIICNPDK